MSKKKLLAGKKTKLAKHALTRALTDKSPSIPESSPASAPASPTLSQVVEALRALHEELDQPVASSQSPTDAPRPWPGVEYSFFHLVQDLRELQELLYPGHLPPTLSKEWKDHLVLPRPEVFQKIIRLTVATLQELKKILN